MREDSVVLIDDIQRGTMQKCPHCQGHFLVAAHAKLDLGRGAFGNLANPRIFCHNCGSLTCGRKGCDPKIVCVPFEARLEYAEGTLNKYSDLIKEHNLVQL